MGVTSLLGLLWLLPLGSEFEESDEPVPPTAQAAESQPPREVTAETEDATDAAGTAPDIRLPPPFGTVARDRPLQTVWLIAPDAMSFAGDVISDEGALVVEYMATYGISGDGLALGTDPARRVTVATEELVASLEDAALGGMQPADAVSTVAPRLDAYLDDHTAVIAITTDASLWRSEFDRVYGPDPGRVASTAEGSSAIRSTYVIELRPGSAEREATAMDSLTRHPVVDPKVPGALAHSLARAWVESYGGGWNNNLSD